MQLAMTTGTNPVRNSVHFSQKHITEPPMSQTEQRLLVQVVSSLLLQRLVLQVAVVWLLGLFVWFCAFIYFDFLCMGSSLACLVVFLCFVS
jgi:hypothetical protein